MKSSDLIKLVEANGWQFVRQKGSHKVFKHPNFSNAVVIPEHGKKDLGTGLLHKIMKDAGLK